MKLIDMKYLLVLLLSLFIFSCTPENKSDFVHFSNNYECNIPMVSTYIDGIEVEFIIDTGAAISLIDADWYSKNQDEVIFINNVDKQLHRIAGSTSEE